MSLRLKLLRSLGPGNFGGTSFGDWLRVLRRNRFAVDVPYWPRAAGITCVTLMNSLVKCWEDFRYGRAVNATTVEPPLFVLGIWRSGTTHLHNLLARDERFAFPTTFDVFCPHTFLSTERSGRSMMQWFTPRTRPMDNVAYGADEPQEDEFALATLGLSYMVGLWAFPRHSEEYRRFLLPERMSAQDEAAWKFALTHFLRKLTLKYGRRLILKSPPHTSKIKLLLDLFPDAQFMHIHRHPYQVFQSMCHTWRTVTPWWRLQRGEPGEEQIIRDYADIYAAYFSERRLIPPQNLCEVAFDDLQRDPLGELSRVYEALRLPNFGKVEPSLLNYVESIAGYAKNEFPDLPAAMREKLVRDWQACFDEWGYDP